MSATGATLRGRAAAEGLMVDACTSSRPGGPAHTTDPTTGAVSYGSAPLYSGKCRVQMMTGVRGDNLLRAGERSIVVQSAIISLPIDAPVHRVDDLITVTASALDPQLISRVYRVEDVTHKTYLTARRLICQEVTG